MDIYDVAVKTLKLEGTPPKMTVLKTRLFEEEINEVDLRVKYPTKVVLKKQVDIDCDREIDPIDPEEGEDSPLGVPLELEKTLQVLRKRNMTLPSFPYLVPDLEEECNQRLEKAGKIDIDSSDDNMAFEFTWKIQDTNLVTKVTGSVVSVEYSVTCEIYLSMEGFGASGRSLWKRTISPTQY